MFQSTSGQAMTNQSTSLFYGSAELQGFFWKDYTCLQPLNLKGKQNKLVNATFLNQMTQHTAANWTREKEKTFLEQQYSFQNDHKCSFF